MRSLNPLVITLFLLAFVCVKGFGQCNEIQVKTKVTNTTEGQSNGTIELEVSGNAGHDVSINLFGPRRNNRLDISGSIITDLEKGKYIVVVSGRKEGNNLCPVAINVIIN